MSVDEERVARAAEAYSAYVNLIDPGGRIHDPYTLARLMLDAADERPAPKRLRDLAPRTLKGRTA